MNGNQKITVTGVIQEGIGIGLKNLVPLIGAIVLWLITIWIPYINVGTTIAISCIPIELSKGGVISPLFIFDAKYRRYIGEYFTLIGLMSIAIWPALLFMVVPGIIISIGWSLAIYLLLDKGISPTQAMVQSNKATYGYKWTIFGVGLLMVIVWGILAFIFSKIPYAGVLLNIVLFIVLMVATLGCDTVIYRNLTRDTEDNEPTSAAEEPAKEMI